MRVGIDKLQAVNYLAHAYLSFQKPEVLTGNLISDFVKGRQKLDFPPGIQAGISLHRAIDGFTDSHPVTRRAKSFFRPDYRLYSGPLIDIAYDHFLANDPVLFPTPGDLSAFANRTYEQLAGRSAVFPDRFSRIFPFMRDQDWFTGYRSNAGTFASFGGLARRAAYMPAPEKACRLFELHYPDLQECYNQFFPALHDFARLTLDALEYR